MAVTGSAPSVPIGPVNAGPRLDRLPISSFHNRIFCLIGAGMFFDGYDLYVGTNVLGSAVQIEILHAEQMPQFMSLTFLGMTIGSLITGFVGDQYGRRFTYQFNLMIFGLASLAAAFAPDMRTLNILRFVMGLGLGAEIVVGYSTHDRVRAAGDARPLARLHVVHRRVRAAGDGAARLLIIPHCGWRPMFVICGIGSLIVWYLRKIAAGIAALAGNARPQRRSRSADASDREGGRGRRAAAGAADRRAGAAASTAPRSSAAAAARHGGRLRWC